MIEYIRGTLTGLTPTYAVVEAAGIGYEINITLVAYSALETSVDTQVKLLVHEVIREDAHLLFGFVEERERAMFRALIGVSGVGANTARMILSSIAVGDLELFISTGDYRPLNKVKGIGPKTAQRIIVDLKDKIKLSDGVSQLAAAVTPSSEAFEEALAALVMLGFPRPAAQKVLKKLFDSEPTLKVEAAIKRALAML